MSVIVTTCLWANEGTGLRNSYDLHDLARLRAGVRRHLSRKHLFLALLDEHFYNNLLMLQRALTDGQRFYDGQSGQEQSVLHELHDVSAVRIEDSMGGWSRVLEGFHVRPMSAADRVAMIGLDSVITGPIDWLYDWHQAPVGLPRDPLFDAEVCNAVMTWNDEGADLVLERFNAEKDLMDLPPDHPNYPNGGMRRYLMGGRPSEMVLLRALHSEHKWPILEDPPHQRLLSYKKHVRTENRHWQGSTSVVYFHGKPTLSELTESDPVKQEWLRHG